MKRTSIIIIILAVLCAGSIFSLYVWTGYNNQFYDVNEIQATCSILNILSTEFCTLEYKMNYKDLEQALQDTYPPLEATYSEIVNTIQEPILFRNVGTCSGIIANTRNSCPNPSQCTSNYVCYINPPVQNVFFEFDSEGRLLGTRVPPDNS